MRLGDTGSSQTSPAAMSSVGTPACIMMLAAAELVFASVYAAQADFFLFADLTHSLDGGDILPYERTRADAVTTPVGDFSARYALNANSVSALVDAMQACAPKILAMYIASSDARAVRLTRTTGWLGAVSFVEEFWSARPTYVSLDGGDGELVTRALQTHINLHLIMGDCDDGIDEGFKLDCSLKQHHAPWSTVENIFAEKERVPVPDLIVLCSSSDALPGDLSAYLMRARTQRSASARYVAAYVSASESPFSVRRVLLGFNQVGLDPSSAAMAGVGAYHCNMMCDTQVNMFVSLLLSWTLSLTILLGYGFLHSLDTPVHCFRNQVRS